MKNNYNEKKTNGLINVEINNRKINIVYSNKRLQLNYRVMT